MVRHLCKSLQYVAGIFSKVELLRKILLVHPLYTKIRQLLRLDTWEQWFLQLLPCPYEGPNQLFVECTNVGLTYR